MTISKTNPVAYFCAEYGLDARLPLYAGGLGVLAGDTIKESADQNYPMVALGLLYRGCDTDQQVDEVGWQTESDRDVDPVEYGFEHVYIPNSDQPLFIKVHLTKKDVWARVWKQTVNQTTLYLLDTYTDQNDPEERGIACAIYSGGEDFLLKQQMILGIGGVKVLDKLNITPALYHINEGRPAFLYWQLIRRYMDNLGLSYEEAKTRAKSEIVYTNHTLVRAGNNAFDIQLLKSYALYYAEKMGVPIQELLEPGIDQTNGAFSMTEFALNVSRKASAVSQVHFELSQSIWPEYEWVGITNGVHLPTWQDPEVAECDRHTDELWHVHLKKKQALADFAAQRIGIGYDSNRLVIGWARRIAAYKQPTALLSDIDRLVSICNQTNREVQLVISGRAHSKDTAAKTLLQQLIQAMQQELAGYALYIPNYDIDVARMMVQGVDLWLNTPVMGNEASGTSGMKAAANGVLQLTVEDGWTAEVDWHDLGWTLDTNHISETLYFRLEKDIVPTFYHRDENGVPQEWLERMKRTLALSDYYNTARMLREYQEQLYR
jgi:glycogen phosphorylase